MALDPVIARMRARGPIYRCRFCARDYNQRRAAVACAEDCKQRADSRLELENTFGVGAFGGPAPRRTFGRPAMKAVPLMLKRGRATSSQEDMQNPATPINADATDSTNATAQAPVKYKEFDPKDPFYREGAFYVCRVCVKRYYTKVEVKQCFSSHADADGKVRVAITEKA